MAIRTLPHFSTIIRDTFQLARARLGTLVVLSTAPFIPLLLFSPFIAQILFAVNEGAGSIEAVVAHISFWTSILALVGIILSFVASGVSTAAMLFALASSNDPGPRKAFRVGMERWLAVLFTSVLSALAVLLVMLPGIVFVWWASVALNLSFDEGMNGFSVATLVVTVLLLLPALIVATWYAFSLIPAARGDAWGPDALRLSHRLVHGATMHVFGLLFAWMVLELFFSLLLNIFFPGLDLFRGFVHYYATTILGSAYLVTVYHALRKA